jgi:hypothetical protein
MSESERTVMATDDHAADGLPPGAVAAARPHPSGREALPHSRKFVAATATLIGLAGVAIAVAVGIGLNGGRGQTAGSWSSFQPADKGLQGAQEIADFVAPLYRATPSDQLAVVTAVNLNNPSNPLRVVVPTAGRSGSSGGGSSSSSSSSTASSLQPLPPASTIVYNLCGQGSSDCSIGVGTPSSSRLLLLKREALEMALYSLKYLSGTNTVVAILPPGRAAQGCTGICPKPQATTPTKPVSLALAFDRKELQPWLDHPLRDTLTQELPPTVSQMPNAPEAELVSVITAHGLFQERTEQGQDGSSVVVLSPMAPQ